MRYDISLTFSYAYATPAAGARQFLHLVPADLPGRQRLIAGRLSFDPLPTQRLDRYDFFGNAVTEVVFADAHDDIDIRLQARVEVTGGAAPQGTSLALADIAGAVAGIRDLGPRSPAHFIDPSPRVPQHAEIAAYAREAAGDRRWVADIVEALGLAINADMRFDPKATTVDTPAGEAFRARGGVCQDFTHVMITALRSLGIPSGYVSGLLRTIPPAGKPRLEGADAMHAWVSAWCGPEAGWVEYDPTNAMFAGPDHVVVAYGRDYSEVSPVKGILRTSGSHTIHHAVDMLPLDA